MDRTNIHSYPVWKVAKAATARMMIRTGIEPVLPP